MDWLFVSDVPEAFRSRVLLMKAHAFGPVVAFIAVVA